MQKTTRQTMCCLVVPMKTADNQVWRRSIFTRRPTYWKSRDIRRFPFRAAETCRKPEGFFTLTQFGAPQQNRAASTRCPLVEEATRAEQFPRHVQSSIPGGSSAPGTHGQRHDHAHRPNCDTAIERLLLIDLAARYGLNRKTASRKRAFDSTTPQWDRRHLDSNRTDGPRGDDGGRIP